MLQYYTWVRWHRKSQKARLNSHVRRWPLNRPFCREIMREGDSWARGWGWGRESGKWRAGGYRLGYWEWAAGPQRAGELFPFPRFEAISSRSSNHRVWDGALRLCRPEAQLQVELEVWSRCQQPPRAWPGRGGESRRWLGTKMGARPMIVIESTRVFVSDAVDVSAGIFKLSASWCAGHQQPVHVPWCACISRHYTPKCLSMKCRYVHVSASFC
jgi:hypothetical protein